MSKGEYLIVPKGTKFKGSGKLGVIEEKKFPNRPNPGWQNNSARLFEMIIYWFFLKNVTFYFTKKLETRCK